jgi:hypothetical protein
MHDIDRVQKCTNLWMNELRTIFIINSSHAKFLMEEQKTPTTRIKQKVNNTTNV